MRLQFVAVLILAACLGDAVPTMEPDGGADAGAASDLKDAGSDAGASDRDAGTAADSGTADGGSADAGAPDSGHSDAGSLDAGLFDAGAGDGGIDAGLPAGCVRFHPGHYFREADSTDRKLDAVSFLPFTFKAAGPRFQGADIQIDWRDLEPSPKSYDFSRVASLLQIAKSNGKYLRIRIMDRTFWQGCAGKFAPSDIPLDGSAQNSAFCVAKIWEPAVMDRFIAVHVALVHQFANEPAFLGVDTEETAIGSDTFYNSAQTALSQYAQLKRLANAVHTAEPTMQFIQYINWPYTGDRKYFDGLADNLAAFDGGGGGFGWPDSQTAFRIDGTCRGDDFCWYQVGKDNSHRLLLSPSVEWVPDATRATSENIYDLLVNDLGAHMITWSTWNDGDPNYFVNSVRATVDAHDGGVANSKCPFL